MVSEGVARAAQRGMADSINQLTTNMVDVEKGGLRSGGEYQHTEKLEAAEEFHSESEDAAADADDLALYMEEAGVHTASAVATERIIAGPNTRTKFRTGTRPCGNSAIPT